MRKILSACEKSYRKKASDLCLFKTELFLECVSMFLPGVENRSESSLVCSLQLVTIICLYAPVKNMFLSDAGCLPYVACPPGAAGSCDWMFYTYDSAQPSEYIWFYDLNIVGYCKKKVSNINLRFLSC